mmetsp:Transcript_14572/g.49003  ORF Transcript_14572/g.49003 Transcript_14572/m.49003 type:complete len:247 (-) Transcript_14572:85-825(-)
MRARTHGVRRHATSARLYLKTDTSLSGHGRLKERARRFFLSSLSGTRWSLLGPAHVALHSGRCGDERHSVQLAPAIAADLGVLVPEAPRAGRAALAALVVRAHAPRLGKTSPPPSRRPARPGLAADRSCRRRPQIAPLAPADAFDARRQAGSRRRRRRRRKQQRRKQQRRRCRRRRRVQAAPIDRRRGAVQRAEAAPTLCRKLRRDAVARLRNLGAADTREPRHSSAAREASAASARRRRPDRPLA